jgi:hypothetical protein
MSRVLGPRSHVDRSSRIDDAALKEDYAGRIIDDAGSGASIASKW